MRTPRSCPPPQQRHSSRRRRAEAWSLGRGGPAPDASQVAASAPSVCSHAAKRLSRTSQGLRATSGVTHAGSCHSTWIPRRLCLVMNPNLLSFCHQVPFCLRPLCVSHHMVLIGQPCFVLLPVLCHCFFVLRKCGRSSLVRGPPAALEASPRPLCWRRRQAQPAAPAEPPPIPPPTSSSESCPGPTNRLVVGLLPGCRCPSNWIRWSFRVGMFGRTRVRKKGAC